LIEPMSGSTIALLSFVGLSACVKPVSWRDSGGDPGEAGAARHRITISNLSRDAALDLKRKHKIDVLDHGIRHDDASGYTVQALALPAQIQELTAAGYQVQTHEDAAASGKARQNEVGRGNRYDPP
jgi:hypothetical protein